MFFICQIIKLSQDSSKCANDLKCTTQRSIPIYLTWFFFYFSYISLIAQCRSSILKVTICSIIRAIRYGIKEFLNRCQIQRSNLGSSLYRLFAYECRRELLYNSHSTNNKKVQLFCKSQKITVYMKLTTTRKVQ